MNINEIMANLEAKHPGENEFLQAVKEVLLSVEEVYKGYRRVDRLLLPDNDRRP